VVEDPVREGANAVDPRRHSVEQAAGVDSAGQRLPDKATLGSQGQKNGKRTVGLPGRRRVHR
jgi:hypothetical protein